MTGWSHLTVRADPAKRREVLGFVRHALQDANLDEKGLFEIELAIDEAITNIISHGYPAGGGPLTVGVLPGEEWVTVELRDRGIPFNPLLHPPVDVSAPLGDRKIGGLGVHLIRNLMDEIAYEYRDGENILTMRRRRR